MGGVMAENLQYNTRSKKYIWYKYDCGDIEAINSRGSIKVLCTSLQPKYDGGLKGLYLVRPTRGMQSCVTPTHMFTPEPMRHQDQHTYETSGTRCLGK